MTSSSSDRPRPQGLVTDGRRRRRALPPARGLERIRHADRVLLHLHHDALDPPAQVAIEDERRDGDAKARHGADQGLGDAARERARIAHAARFDGVEGADDSGDRAEQSQERRDSGDGAERIKEALELVHHVAPGVLETLHQRSEEHTSELQSQSNLVCRLLLEKKKNIRNVSSRLGRKIELTSRAYLWI